MKKSVIIPLAIMLAWSCVPPTKFKALQSETMSCREERDMLRAENEKLSVDNRELSAKLARAQRDLARAGRDTIKWQEEVTRLNRQNAILKSDYNDLKEAQQALMKGSEVEIKRLMTDLQSSQVDLQKRENDLNKLSADVNARKSELDRIQKELEQRNARLAELEQVLQEQQAAVASLRKKVSDALLGFENQGLTISQRNGKVYVSLEEQLLFKSGSTAVDPKGASALRKLAAVLEQNQDINVMIEGHTDDVPVITGSVYKDNWDLSVLRATSIVRILLENSSINPQRLTSAGRSQYQPVDPAKTTDARQKNRRTEIILSPNLEELYKLVE
ncbi:MAG TPA: OmpA family protein [Bacteroidales bacterium]|nr:OmpA family protein [Bacteroidales bacterium]